jgi:hypothetical protein
MNLGIRTVCHTCAGASRLTVERPVDIGEILAGLQQKIQTSNAPDTVRLYGQTVMIPRFTNFSDQQRAGYCQTVWANSHDSKIH